MSHKITFEEMTSYLNTDVWNIAASSSNGGSSSKRLETSNNGTFRVTDRGTVTYIGASLGLAVDAYNEAP